MLGIFNNKYLWSATMLFLLTAPHILFVESVPKKNGRWFHFSAIFFHSLINLNTTHLQVFRIKLIQLAIKEIRWTLRSTSLVENCLTDSKQVLVLRWDP